MMAAGQGMRARRAEQGIALIWAIIIMMIVIGLLVVVAMSAMSTTRDAKDSASRTRAVFWAEAAGKDLVNRIDNAELGPWVQSIRPNGDMVLTFASPGNPQGAGTPTLTTFPNGASGTRALPLANSSGGQRGWYQVLPPVTGLQPWTGLRVRDAANPGDQGSIQFLVRAWNDSRNASPVIVRLELRRNSLSRFSILSEDQLTLGGIGNLQLGGLIHTNNTRGAAQAIQIGAGTNISGVQRITTTSGSISGGGCGSNCRPNVRETVSFGSAGRAMEEVARLSQKTTPFLRCSTASFVACSIGMNGYAAPANTMPVFTVNLGGAGGCVVVGRQNMPMRTDTGGVPAPNDRLGPNAGTTGLGTYCPARGGGAMVFDGDVILTGRRAGGSAAVTIMARRTAAFPRVTMGATQATVTIPASIYLLQTSSGAGVGTVDPNEPVGAVAQGGVYLPSWAMRTVNNSMVVSNIAAMAVSGEIAYSPSIQSIAADGATPGGLGITPATGQAMGYGFGTNLSFSGALLSGGRMAFRYGQAAQYLGYGTRSFTYVPSLTWNAPPYFPADADWHLADWTEFDS